METGITPEQNALTTEPAPQGRRLSKKSLGLLAAAAVAAGSIGSVALMANPSAAEPTEPSYVESTFEGSTDQKSIDDSIVRRAFDEVANLTGEDSAEVPAPHDFDNCPACGMG